MSEDKTKYENATMTLVMGIAFWVVAALFAAFSTYAGIEFFSLILFGFICVISGIVGMIQNKPS